METKRTFNKKGYVLTQDNYLKMLKIYQFASLQVPIVIMGATGCGKTYMFDFMVNFVLKEDFECVTLNAGYTEQDLERDLLRIVEKCRDNIRKFEMKKIANDSAQRVWVLFDEFNTSALQCLIAEIMTERKCTFTHKIGRIPENLIFVAACNPYRINKQTSKVGIVHRATEEVLSHRVYPIPDSLLNYIWNFGQLKEKDEKLYIRSMFLSDLETRNFPLENIDVIIACQRFIRGLGSDSSVSLRDVSRYCDIYKSYQKIFTEQKDDPMVMTAYLCYFLRLDSAVIRSELDTLLSKTVLKRPNGFFMKRFTKLSEEYLQEAASFGTEGNEVVPKNIAQNRPLRENFLAVVTCTMLKIPLMICGKPGTSKTTAINIAEKLFELIVEDDKAINSKYFKEAKGFIPIKYWGSVITTSVQVSEHFEMAAKRAAKTPDKNVQVVFDEIGLAELSPDNPLKVLHPLLEQKDRLIGFIGLSNWTLDLSKMNRMIYVAQPDLDTTDLIDICKLTEKASFEKDADYQRKIGSLCKAYEEFTKGLKNDDLPDFHGSRDFYFTRNLIDNYIEDALRSTKVIGDGSNDEKCHRIDILIESAINRNFSGRRLKGFKRPADWLIEHYYKLEGRENQRETLMSSINPIKLINLNLIDNNARHLMVFIDSSSAIEDIVIEELKRFATDVQKKDPSKFEFLNGIKRKEDYVKVLFQIEMMIKEGYTLVLKNMDEIYGCLFDLFNQSYIDNGDTKLCHMFINNQSRKITVHDDFKCIILMEPEDSQSKLIGVEKKQIPPFLNRFEKHLLEFKDLLEPHVIQRLEEEVEHYFPEKDLKTTFKYQKLIHNLSKDLIYSKGLQNNDLVNSKFDEKLTLRKYYSELFTWMGEIDASHNDEEKSEREQDSHELTSLFSGNYIFEKSLTTKEGYKLKEFKERFLRTHLFNSLQDFLTSDQIDFKQTHSIIFTNTQSWKVEPLIAQMYQQKAVTQEMNWITSNEILDKIGSKKESYYKDLVSREGFLLVSFVNRSDWSHIQEVRFNIEKQPFRAAKIIFLAHTTLRDLETNVIGKSSISFATRKWRMYAIDDLLKCDYENLFKLLSDSSYIKALFTNKEEIRLLKMDIAFKRVKDHLIEKDNSLTNVLRVGKLMKLLEENEKFKEFVANISHHTNIMDKMTIKDFITKKLTNFEARLANYVDSRDYLTEVKSNLLASIMDDEFKAFTKYLDSGIVELSGYIDRNCRDRIFDLMMTEISGETNDRDRICKLRNVTWNQQHETGYNIELFHSKYLPEVQKFGLKDETIGVLEDLDSRRFEEEPENKDTIPTKIQSSELDEKGSKFMAKLADILKSEKVRNIDLLRLEESSSHVHENYLLCALLVLEKYVGTFYPNCLEDVTFKLVARMSDFCLKDIESKQDRTFSMKETINIMLVLFETYREEITFIVSQLRTTLMINKDQIVELLGSSFENYRILMHPIFLDNLVKLIFDSKEELQALINNFRLSIEFEGNCDRIPQKELNLLFKRFVLKFLEHWYSLTQSQTDWKRISKKCSTIQLTTPKKQEMAFFFKSLICLLIEEVEPMNSNQFFSANIQMIFEIIEHPVLKDSDKESVMGLYVEYCFKLEHNIDNQIFIIASTIVRSQKVSSPSEKGRIIEREISQFKPLTCCLKSLSVINAVNKDKFDQNLRLLQTHIINGMYQTRRVQLRSTDKLPVRFIERIGNLKRILTGMTENYNNQKSKILSADLIESIVEYKLAIMQMSCKPEWLTLDIKCEIERTLETILTTSPSKDKDFAYLILIRELYRIYISTEQLRENNFNKIAKTIEDLETRLGGYKIISLFDQMEAFTLKVSTERKLDQLIKNQFAERIQILNLALYHRKGIEDVLVAHQFLNSLSTTPMFQSFYKELIPLRNQNANQQMFFCIGALINLMSSVDGTYISENSLGADQCNPLYNFPGEAPLRNAIVYGDGSGYTAMWKCVGCGLFVPLGNCGQIGHAEFKESSGSCQGCRRGIGVGSEQNMIRVTAEEIASITNLKVVTNRKIFNLEPENANKEWMSIIYFDQIQSLDLAHFIQLFQYLLLSCLKALGRCTNIPQTHLNKEIEADIQYLCRHHQKDPRDMWTMVVLIIFELKQQLSASPSAFSNDVQMRTLLKKVYEESTMNFANTIGTYNEALQAKSREVEEKNFPRNFIKATLSDQQLSQMKEKEVVDLMVYLQDRNPVTVIQLRDHLEALKLNDNQQNPSFLLELIDKGRILARMKGILQCLRDFQLEIRKCFSGLNDKNQLKTKTMMEFIQDNRNENMNSDEYDLRNQVPESIEGGFARFSEEWAKIKNLFRSESQHIRFKYECQELNLLELIEKLDKDSQAMMVYILHVAKGGAGNPDMLEIVMASAVGVLVDIQNAFIEQYLSIIDKRKSNKSAISKKNFLKCSDSNFIDLNINVVTC
jgi:hypothetical protein